MGLSISPAGGGGSDDWTVDASDNLYSNNAATPLGTNNFFAGRGVGVGNTSDVNYCIWIGDGAGNGATNATSSVFIGNFAGQNAAGATGLFALGDSAGSGATGASGSVFIGASSGISAANAFNSLFFGGAAGSGATNAAHSIFIGDNAGLNDTVDNTVSGNSIAIGISSGTGGFKDSIALGTGTINSRINQVNIGNLIYGVNIYNLTTQSSSVVAGGKVGIGVDPSPTARAGSEKITNGTFTGAATGWTLAAGWSYSANAIHHNTNGTGTAKQTSAGMVTPLVIGNYYTLVYTVSNYTVGSVTPSIAGVTLTARSANGTYTETFKAVSTADLAFTPTNTARFDLDTVSLKRILGGDLHLGGTVPALQGIATAGLGVAGIYAAGRSIAQVAAVASVAAYTVGEEDGTFEITANVLITTATTHSFNVTVTYTDEGGTSRTVTLNFSTLAGVISNAAITNVGGAVPYEGIPLHIRCKQGTAITIATTGTFTSVVYNVEGIIKQTA